MKVKNKKQFFISTCFILDGDWIPNGRPTDEMLNIYKDSVEAPFEFKNGGCFGRGPSKLQNKQKDHIIRFI